MANGNNGEKKNVLEKIRRLMTVTEKDVIEEKEAERKALKEAVPDYEADFSEDTQSFEDYTFSENC